MPFLLFLKKQQFFNCRLLQIIGGALCVKTSGYDQEMRQSQPNPCENEEVKGPSVSDQPKQRRRKQEVPLSTPNP